MAEINQQKEDQIICNSRYIGYDTNRLKSECKDVNKYNTFHLCCVSDGNYIGFLILILHLFFSSGFMEYNERERNGAMDSAPDCCTIRGAVARFESFAKHFVS